MPQTKPRFLYKYCSADRALQVLRDRYLYLCPPKDLNDLYEGSLGRLLRYTPEIGFELMWRNVVANTGYDEAEAKRVVKECVEETEIRANFESTVTKLKEMNALLREHSGITCFSEAVDNQRMWGTYGDNHGGVCIEFCNTGSNSLIEKECLPVGYTNKRLDTYLPELMQEDGSLDVSRFAEVAYLLKTTDWESEKEWRILMLANSPQTMESRKVVFTPADVKRIFMGPRISLKAKEELAATASGWSVFALRANVDTGVTEFDGIDNLSSSEDLEYWISRRQSHS